MAWYKDEPSRDVTASETEYEDDDDDYDDDDDDDDDEEEEEEEDGKHKMHSREPRQPSNYLKVSFTPYRAWHGTAWYGSGSRVATFSLDAFPYALHCTATQDGGH